MASNLRSKRMQGYITDSAGNILRNANIVIKEDTPLSTNTVVSVKSDDDGSFSTTPLPSGVYDIYESGIRVARQIHVADPNSIPAYKAAQANFPNSFQQFAILAENGNLNDYQYVIQIEQESVFVALYGNTFPLIDRNLLAQPAEYAGISSFYNFTNDTRVTTTRFDIEYFAPLTSSDRTYKRIRWAGVPAIRFFAESRLVVPLDYYSIVANIPKAVYTDLSVSVGFSDENNVRVSSAATGLSAFATNISTGDIVKFKSGSYVWYGIYHKRSGADMVFKKWGSSNYVSTMPASSLVVSDLHHFDGFFSTMSNINELANERFTVVENVYAQNQVAEIYNYSTRS
jgi:hypothetical protein